MATMKQNPMTILNRSKDQPPVQKQVSIQAQLEANDVPEYANEPGPGHYFGPENHGFSCLGNQKFSHCQSAPELEFARTGWKEWSKVIISKGHEGAYKLRDSPGAVYDLPNSSLGGTSTVIGTGQRPDLSMSLGMNPDGSPGPNINTRDTKPKQIKITREQFNSKTDRFSDGHVFKGPGPYSRKDHSLQFHTGKSFGIGRAAYEKVIRPGWEKDFQCKTSSKIGEATVWTDIEKNPCSNASTIGRAERFPKDKKTAASPGPGQYRRDERDLARCVSCCSDTRNPGGRLSHRLPRKPRFRMVLAVNTAERGGWGYF